MLIKCEECSKEVSDKASACPNCGCPVDKFNSELFTVQKSDGSVCPELEEFFLRELELLLEECLH